MLKLKLMLGSLKDGFHLFKWIICVIMHSSNVCVKPRKRKRWILVMRKLIYYGEVYVSIFSVDMQHVPNTGSCMKGETLSTSAETSVHQQSLDTKKDPFFIL